MEVRQLGPLRWKSLRISTHMTECGTLTGKGRECRDTYRETSATEFTTNAAAL